MIKSKRNIFLLISMLLYWQAISVQAQESSFRLDYNAQVDELICSKLIEVGSDVSSTVVSQIECLRNADKLRTPLRYILSDNGKCHIFIDSTPFYFVGEESDLSKCSSTTNITPIDQSLNIIKYSQTEVNNSCTELANCLSILGVRNQDVVDNSIQVLERIAIDSEMQRLRNSVDQDQLDFVLPEFMNSLDQLHVQNESCQYNLSYGSGSGLAARAALAADLRSIENTLEEDLLVFHWYDGITSPLFTSHEGDSNIIARSHAKMLQSNYFSRDDKQGTGLQGRGLYASASPRATQSYGDILLQIKIPAGSRYLNMGGEGAVSDTIPLSAQTVELLEKAGCDITDSRVYHRDNRSDGGLDVNKIVFSSDRSCRRIYNDVIRNEGYVFHSYSYRGRRNSICGQDGTDYAFVLIQNEMSAENVTAFNDPFNNVTEESEEVRDLADLAKKWGDLSTERQVELSQKYNKHLWRCSSADQH